MISNFNQAAVVALQAAVKSQATALGIFRRVIAHEPKSAPGNGVSCALWMGPIDPVQRLSGLNRTAGRVIMYARVYVPWLATDEDATESELVHAILELIAAYSGGITVGATIYGLDLLGAYGPALETSAVGYIEHDGTHYRAAELTIPAVITDLWTQAN